MATTSFFRSPPNQRLQNSLINTQTLTFFVKKQILVLRLVIYVNSTTTMLLPLQHGQKLVWVLPPVSSLCAKLISFSATCAQHLSPRHISRWGQRSISYRTSLKRTVSYRNVSRRTYIGYKSWISQIGTVHNSFNIINITQPKSVNYCNFVG